MKQKRVAAIHDISGFGKCSLTVALAIISAAGIETAVLPTSVLSTHTGGFSGYTFRDLTDDIPSFTEHWKKLGLAFDTIYTGYLGSARQISMVSDFIDTFGEAAIKVVDPAMADHGKLYVGFCEDFPKYMLELCKKADVIVPNITEALFMLGREYVSGPYTMDFIEDILFSLRKEGIRNIVLTGVYFDDNKIGAAVLNNENTEYIMNRKINKIFHGTGDVFASALTAALTNGMSLEKAARIAVDFTVRSVETTIKNNPERSYGVNFEQELPWLVGEVYEQA